MSDLEKNIIKALRKHHRRFVKEHGWQDGLDDFTEFYAPFITAAIEAAAGYDKVSAQEIPTWDDPNVKAALSTLRGKP